MQGVRPLLDCHAPVSRRKNISAKVALARAAFRWSFESQAVEIGVDRELADLYTLRDKFDRSGNLEKASFIHVRYGLHPFRGFHPSRRRARCGKGILDYALDQIVKIDFTNLQRSFLIKCSPPRFVPRSRRSLSDWKHGHRKGAIRGFGRFRTSTVCIATSLNTILAKRSIACKDSI